MKTPFQMEEKPKDSPALIADTGVQVTYGELVKQMETFQKCIPTRGLVFCMCRNEPGAVIGYLGTMAADCVPLLLAADLKEAQFAAFFETYRPAYVWASAEWMKANGAILQELMNKISRDLAKMHGRQSEGIQKYSMHEQTPKNGQESANGKKDESRISASKNLQHPFYEAYGYGLWATGNEPYEMHPDLGLLLATSGSTGDPKLVRLSRRNLQANAESICAYLQLDATERPITTLPMQYTYGLSIINSHLLAGAAILMTTAGYVQTAFWDFFAAQGATSFGGVPYTYEILKKIHLFQKKLPSLRSITQAGGKLSVSLQKEVAEWAQAQNVRFFVMYGQTEATARMGYLPPDMCLNKLGSMGIAIPGGRFSLVDENGQEMVGSADTGLPFGMDENGQKIRGTNDENLLVENEEQVQQKSRQVCGKNDGSENLFFIGKSADASKQWKQGKEERGYSAIGELVYTGENVSLGYAKCAEDLRLGDERHGVLYTGDLAKRDADGYYYIVGRKKRFVKIFGVRVSLDACEQTLRGWYPGVDLACAGSDNCLNIYLACGKAEMDPDWQNAAERLAEYLHLNRKAFRVVELERIPKNAAGKIQYRELGNTTTSLSSGALFRSGRC